MEKDSKKINDMSIGQHLHRNMGMTVTSRHAQVWKTWEIVEKLDNDMYSCKLIPKIQNNRRTRS